MADIYCTGFVRAPYQGAFLLPREHKEPEVLMTLASLRIPQRALFLWRTPMSVKERGKQLIVFEADRELAQAAAAAARAQTISASAWWRLAGLKALGARHEETAAP